MTKCKSYIVIVYLSLLVAACGDGGGDTVKPDDKTTSPIVSANPPSGATDVPVDAVITATFREDMDSSTVNNTTFTLHYNPPVSGTVTYDKITRIATFIPDSLLALATTYTATITTGAKNSSGTPLASSHSWSFTITPTFSLIALSLPVTGQTSSYAAGDDGAIQSGVVWPSPRFTDHGDGTITDELTGLMWLKDGACLGYQEWNFGSFREVDSLNYDPQGRGCQDYTGRYTDWRLPNVNELESLVHAGRSNTATWLNSVGFTGVQALDYWSSTTNVHNPGQAWSVNMWTGFVDPDDKGGARHIIAVRGTSTGPARVWKTGQVTSYRPGDDGDLQKGERWPALRLTTAYDTDLLTGLVWMHRANTPTQVPCTGGRKTWQEALDYVACLNAQGYGGASNWRLPNRKELYSLIDRSQMNTPLPAGYGYQDVMLERYWTSTTYAYDRGEAWLVSMRYAWADPAAKTSTAYVWPVRDLP